MNVLETGIVDELSPVHLAIADLDPVLHLAGVVRLARQHERTTTQSAIVPCVLVVAIAGRQCLRGRQLVVDAGADVGAGLRVGHRQIAKRPRSFLHYAVFRLARSRIGHVRHIGIDDAVVLDVPPVEIKEERCLLAQRTTHVTVVLQPVVRRLVQRKRIRRIKSRSTGIHKHLAVQLVCARLGQYLDPPITRLVILSREWILVDDDGANRRLGWQLPAGEPIDVDLAPARARSRTGQRSQFI